VTHTIIEAPSPNQDERDAPVDVLLLHYTGMQSGQAAIDRLRDPAARVSSHYVVEEDGTIWRLVPEHRRAWHAGISHWRAPRTKTSDPRGMDTLNGRSVGIEIVNPGHEWGYRPFPAAQMAAVTWLCQGVLARHPIPPTNVVGHSDVAPDRKDDPGELFDWPGLARAGIGLWPTGDAAPPAELDVPGALRAIGYPIPDLATTIRAFQRRWLPHGITGLPDAATRARIAAVLAAYEA
jgi:N-acetylmuramoyl-L-alanine amidase